ncbi:MAG: fdhA2 [Anaerosolibacter sp.]|jgi:formate dehydrogenase major subunit|nr:fdhA2 [Anaerosolibacter sp.]
MISLTINGQKILTEHNKTILEAAEAAGISVPTFCNDKRLIPHGACRICLVEVEGVKNLPASCTTPVAEGMVIRTHSERVVQARREILSLLLSNHPLDCLTCEKSGKCKLQDYCYEYDVKEDIYGGEKYNFPIDASNPFYQYDPNKCIVCEKCVRVCNELQCTGAIGLNERGFLTHMGTPFEMGMKHTNCVSCGNCVSACPVGALLPKNKEKYRLWQVATVKTTCAYCGVGCQLELHVKEDRVVAIQPGEGSPNDGLLCVKGKFGYSFIHHNDRLKTPLVRKNGELREASWKEAYELIVEKMQQTKATYGADAFAGLTSARCTNEENYLFQKLFRAVIGTNNVDHCARL